MAIPPTLARPPYHRRPVPKTYDAGWVGSELNNIQRAIPSTRTRHVLAADSPTTQDGAVFVNASAAPVTITLPPPTQVQGWELTIKKTDSSGNAVTVAGVIDGATNPTLATQYKAMTIVSDGLTYYKVASV